MCHCAASEGKEINMHTGEFAFVVVCAHILLKHTARGCIKTVLGQTPRHLSVLMRSTKSRPSACFTPFSFLLMNCLETWQQEAHKSFSVTFRCHFIEIIFILIYRKLSSALQECHFKVPSIQLHPLPYLVRECWEISLLIFQLLCYGSLHTICEKWQCHIRPLQFCQAAPPTTPIHCHIQPQKSVGFTFRRQNYWKHVWALCRA